MPNTIPNTWQFGDRIRDRYEVRQVLGGPDKSEAGIIYVCYDQRIEDWVAIKSLQEQYLWNKPSLERFRWEAEVGLLLEKHPNIVQTRYIEEDAHGLLIVMEYIKDDVQHRRSLRDWRYPLAGNLPLTLNFAIQCCHGMIYANKRFREIGKPFVYRNFQLSNILVTEDGTIKIGDFSLVKNFARPDIDISPQIQHDKICSGWPFYKPFRDRGGRYYTSPEQCRGDQNIDARADIYSFGCVFYEIIVGNLPFPIDVTEYGTAYHTLNTLPKPPQTDPELSQVIMKCLEKDPANRYQDFRELEKALSEIYYRMTEEIIEIPGETALESWELNDKGTSLAKLGLFDEAINCFLRALRLDPDDVIIHKNLGAAYLDQGRPEDAVREFQKAIKFDPGNERAHYDLGRAYDDMGKPDEAKKEFLKTLELDPVNAEAHNALGVIYDLQAQPDLAIREYRETLKLNPDDSISHNNLGVIYADRKQFKKALKEYESVLNFDPNNARTRFNLGCCFGYLKKRARAVEEYRKAIHIDPYYISPRHNLALTLEEMRKYREAIDEWKALQNIVPYDPDYVEIILTASWNIDHLERRLHPFKYLLDLLYERCAVVRVIVLVARIFRD